MILSRASLVFKFVLDFEEGEILGETFINPMTSSSSSIVPCESRLFWVLVYVLTQVNLRSQRRESHEGNKEFTTSFLFRHVLIRDLDVRLGKTCPTCMHKHYFWRFDSGAIFSYNPRAEIETTGNLQRQLILSML